MRLLPELISSQKEISTQAIRFIVVGILAMTVHFIAASLWMALGVPPLIANVGAFLTAFPVSYAGHLKWSFASQGEWDRSSLPRFAATALAGFAGNEMLYALLLHFTNLPPRLALLLVLGTVAASTFLLCRFWVFHRKAP
ncbi:GtrA family protein [Luteolibacter pohnpeiensis]|uniref:GtrA family protein n=1 Tax=Luteolibacter pohnpeiensis TaxID=454153 RepID=A0A934S5P2_9BACT|nr:GtrA family protein [Luteolibacter pohnpeiensis]MBK1883061.1 GtrA family protein [Luteolibacter pohnpeiensis]